MNKMADKKNVDERLKNLLSGGSNKMVFYGPSAGGVSWNGVKTDILKSALQKYIRRGNTDKAIWCVMEMELFSELAGDDKVKLFTKSFMTLTMNRLFAISCEDIGLGNPAFPLLMNKVFLDYHKGTNGKLKTDANKRRGTLINIVVNACKSKKSRMLSWLRTVYYQVFSMNRMEYVEQYKELYAFDRNSKDTVEAFKKCYDDGKDACFFWFFKEMFKNGEKTVKPTEYVDKMIVHVIEKEKEPLRKKTMLALKDWFKKISHKEKFLYASQIVLLGLRKPKIDETFDKDDDYKKYLMKNLNGEVPELDAFVYDKHTRDGKDKGTGLFATEGSYVENELLVDQPLYKDIYVDFRSKQDSWAVDVKPARKRSKSSKDKEDGNNDDEEDDKSLENKAKKRKPAKKSSKSSKNEEDDKSLENKSKKRKPAKNGDFSKLNVTPSGTIKTSVLNDMNDVKTMRGQILRGVNKKQVLIPDTGDFKGKVVKGPWSLNTDNKRLRQMLARMEVGKLMGLRLNYFSIYNVEGKEDEYYTVYDNVASTESKDWKYKLVEDKHVGKQLRIAVGSSLGISDISKLTVAEREDVMLKQGMFYEVLIMNILRTGDFGMWNMLATRRDNKLSPMVIDYEEECTRELVTVVNKLFSKNVSGVDSLLKKFLDDKETIKKYVKNIDDKLDDIKKIVVKYELKIDVDAEWSAIKNVINAK